MMTKTEVLEKIVVLMREMEDLCVKLAKAKTVGDVRFIAAATLIVSGEARKLIGSAMHLSGDKDITESVSCLVIGLEAMGKLMAKSISI